jgi:glycosyltransferase involved in cell wall biosynthesis
LKSIKAKNKIKIVYLLNSLEIGGTQKVVLDLCINVDLEKFDITIVVLSRNYDILSQYQLPLWIKIIYTDYLFENNYSLRSHLKLALFKKITQKRAKQVLKIISDIKPDILHLHTTPRELLIGILAQNQIHCELVYTDHLVRLKQNEYKWYIQFLLIRIFRRLYKYYNLIAVSKTVEFTIKQFDWFNNNKTFKLIENTIDLKTFTPKNKKQKNYISVVYVARLESIKGHFDLLEAWKKIDSPVNKKLFIVGDGVLRERIEHFIAESKLENSVVLLGKRNDIYEILNEADIAVFPSHNEGLPLSLLEKMAMELPIVASDTNELSSIIINNFNGLLFKCGNSDDLAKKLSIFLADEPLRKQLGKNARETVIKDFSINTAEQNEKFYLSVLDKNKNDVN